MDRWLFTGSLVEIEHFSPFDASNVSRTLNGTNNPDVFHFFGTYLTKILLHWTSQ